MSGTFIKMSGVGGAGHVLRHEYGGRCLAKHAYLPFLRVQSASAIASSALELRNGCVYIHSDHRRPGQGGADDKELGVCVLNDL